MTWPATPSEKPCTEKTQWANASTCFRNFLRVVELWRYSLEVVRQGEIRVAGLMLLLPHAPDGRSLGRGR